MSIHMVSLKWLVFIPPLFLGSCLQTTDESRVNFPHGRIYEGINDFSNHRILPTYSIDPILFDDQHRRGCVLEYLIGHAPKKEARDRPQSFRSHDNQVRPLRGRHF